MRISFYLRRILFLIFDSAMITIALYSSLLLSNSNLINIFFESKYYIIPILIGIPLYLFTGQYKGLLKYVGSSGIYSLLLRNLILTSLLFIINLKYYGFNISDSNFWVIYYILLFLFTAAPRYILRDLVLNQNKKKIRIKNVQNVLIFGAGEAGALLSKNIIKDIRFNLIGFIDDNKDLWYRSVDNIKIFPPKILKNNKYAVQKILLAIPSLNNQRKREIITDIKSMGYEILEIPTISEISEGLYPINNLKPISYEQLLGRDEVKIDLKIVENLINNKTICITGAGGSIGSEISRQILELNPRQLLLVDMSEASLYKIQKKLEDVNKKNIPIKVILSDLSSQKVIENFLSKTPVDRIFHCAAYKHVPLVEFNPLEGLSNNIMSTFFLCKAAINQNVNQFTLISTDKAVRPTNIMGASKRIAEMVIRVFSNQKNKTIFSIVRFGNVIGSSGSVVPLFLNQIRNRMPITITDINMTRYFMTIKEAANLVIQTAQYAKGGELFLLDMGKPMKILDLAYQLVNLSGLKIRDEENPDGDIDLKITGMRKGEKLYEELLIDAESENTAHPRIFKAYEKNIPDKDVLYGIRELEIAFKDYDIKSAIKTVKKLVPEWSNNL